MKNIFIAWLVVAASLFSAQTIAAESKTPVTQDQVAAEWDRIELLLDQERVNKIAPDTSKHLDTLLSGLSPAQYAHEKRMRSLDAMVKNVNREVVVRVMEVAAVRLAKYNDQCDERQGHHSITEAGWHDGEHGPYYFAASSCSGVFGNSTFWLAGYPLSNGKFAVEVEVEAGAPDGKNGQRTSD
ncbi:MAG: hypothetical protein Q8K01_14185, partial [Sulfurimicrobium sp.]|nr:hypothetical protein [Sulfurimicrobium sp.]